MASKYGEVFDIYNTHHVETKAKLDALLAKNTEIAVNNDGVESLLTDGNSSHVVSSSALPSGASLSSKQDEIKTLITATNTALAGTLTVSGSIGGTLTKTDSTPVNAEAINGQSDYTSAEIDINTARHFTIFGSSSDTANSHEVDVLVSNVSGGTYYETSHSGYYLEGNFHLLVSHMPYRYIKIKVKNGDPVSNSADFTIHLVHSN
jgi:hypothetical protein